MTKLTDNPRRNNTKATLPINGSKYPILNSLDVKSKLPKYEATIVRAMIAIIISAINIRFKIFLFIIKIP